MASQAWDGRPVNPDLSGWYWLVRQNGPSLRHAAWFRCDQCHQWEAEPGLSLAPSKPQPVAGEFLPLRLRQSRAAWRTPHGKRQGQV